MTKCTRAFGAMAFMVVLAASVQPSAAADRRVCPAPRIDVNSPNPRAELERYVRSLDNPAVALGLPKGTDAARTRAFLQGELRLRAGSQIGLSGEKLVTPPLSPVARDDALRLLEGIDAPIRVSRQTASAMESMQESAERWRPLTARNVTGSRVELDRVPLTPIALRPKVPEDSPAVEAGLRLPRSGVPFKVVDPGRDFGQPRQGGVKEVWDRYVTRCSSSASEMKKWFFKNEDGVFTDLKNGLFRPDEFWPLVVDNHVLSYVNIVDNYDCACLLDESSIPPDVTDTVGKNIGVVYRKAPGKIAQMLGTATVVGNGILLTASHVARDKEGFSFPLGELKIELFGRTPTAKPLQVIDTVEPTAFYQKDDDPTDYVLLVVREDTGEGLPIDGSIEVGTPLRLFGLNGLIYVENSLLRRISGVAATVPTWRSAFRWDDNPACEVKEWIGQNVCFQHGCQSEHGDSGAALFSLTGGRPMVRGIHIRGAGGAGCLPSKEAVGNVGIALDAARMKTLIETAAKKRG